MFSIETIQAIKTDLATIKLPGFKWHNGTLVDTMVSPTIYERGDGTLLVSGEEGDGAMDYYQETVREYVDDEGVIHNSFGIIDAIHAAAEKHNCYWEWENPGCISLAY